MIEKLFKNNFKLLRIRKLKIFLMKVSLFPNSMRQYNLINQRLSSMNKIQQKV